MRFSCKCRLEHQSTGLMPCYGYCCFYLSFALTKIKCAHQRGKQMKICRNRVCMWLRGEGLTSWKSHSNLYAKPSMNIYQIAALFFGSTIEIIAKLEGFWLNKNVFVRAQLQNTNIGIALFFIVASKFIPNWSRAFRDSIKKMSCLLSRVQNTQINNVIIKEKGCFSSDERTSYKVRIRHRH